MSIRVLMAAGGTGGHVIPALTVAQGLKQRDPSCSCVTISGEHGMTEQFWDPAVGTIEKISVQPWPRRRDLVNPRYWWRQGRAVIDVVRLLRRYRPQVVVGFGSYIAGPTVMLAKLTGTPTIIHEQNVFPGRTTRILSRWADRVAVSFDETRRHLPDRAGVTVTGNPVREDVGAVPRAEALRRMGLASETPVLLIMGGSQGSHRINQVCLEAMAQLTPAQRRSFQVVHATGAPDAPDVADRYRALGICGQVHAFLSTMGLAYAAATLAITRGGANTLSEIVATATPSVIVPYPYAAAHQAINAQWLSRHGGALYMDQGVFTSERWLDTIFPLLHDAARLQVMRAALAVLATPGATARVVDAVLEEGHAT